MNKTIWLQALSDGFLQAICLLVLMDLSTSVFAYDLSPRLLFLIIAVVALAGVVLYRVFLQYKLLDEMILFALVSLGSSILFTVLLFAAKSALSINFFPMAEVNVATGILLVLVMLAFILLSAIGRLIALLICASKARRDWV
ncbi:MAG: hypothetical protein IJW98_04200 [Clostridia bacterium]|nr:hypothetical protein [Clostridia bacterium]